MEFPHSEGKAKKSICMYVGMYIYILLKKLCKRQKETKPKENARWQGGAKRKLRVLLRLLLILPSTNPKPPPWHTLYHFAFSVFGQVQFWPTLVSAVSSSSSSLNNFARIASNRPTFADNIFCRVRFFVALEKDFPFADLCMSGKNFKLCAVWQ